MGLEGTELARAQAGTIRTLLLEIGGYVEASVRRIAIALSPVFSEQDVVRQALAYSGSRSRDEYGPAPTLITWARWSCVHRPGLPGIQALRERFPTWSHAFAFDHDPVPS